MSKTIRGIPNCGAPAGCSSVVIVPREERSASGEHQGKKSRFSVQKGQKSSVSLQAVGKWRKTFFPLADDNNTCLAFSPPDALSQKDTGLRETGPKNELIIFTVRLVICGAGLGAGLNGWCATHPPAFSPCVCVCARALSLIARRA